MRYFLISLFAIALFAGCTKSNGNSDRTPESTLDESYDIFALNDAGFPLSIRIPKQKDAEITAKWNAAFGRMEISNDLGVDLFVKEDTLSCASKKEELEMGIFSIEYVVDTDSMICYKSTLPDGSAAYWHIYASFPIGGVHYTFENNPLVEVNKSQIELMKNFIMHTNASTGMTNPLQN